MAKANDRFGPYELSTKLGSGGNGEVWLARGPDGDVALKLLKSRGAVAAARFEREVKALEKLRGMKGILPLLGANAAPTDGSAAWFAMPVAMSLRARLGSTASLSDLCASMGSVADVLSRIHDLGLVHRDIKPDNLYWFENEWCLGDFGLVDGCDLTSLTDNDHKLGPAYYIAPEMLNNPASADGKKADVYSLAKTLWVLATGQNFPLPGVHDPAFSAIAITSARNDPRAAALDELLRRMTQLDPSSRPIAAVVAKELLSFASRDRDAVATVGPSLSSSLEQLKASVVGHLSREAEEERQVLMLRATGQQIADVIEEIKTDIERSSGLRSDGFHQIPQHWGFRPHIGTARVIDEFSIGYTFSVRASSWGWRLLLACRCQLLSDSNVHLHAGYHIDRLLQGQTSNTIGGPRLWNSGALGMNGAPSAAKIASDLIQSLRDELPETLKQFADLAKNLSQQEAGH
jgi:serine/threonine protein kinase